MIDQAEIGKRIAMLRNHGGYSQEEIARILGIPRSSLAQVENGNRTLSALELHALSMHLHFSMDSFFGKRFKVAEEGGEVIEEKKTQVKERISVPKLNEKKFRQVLLYILEQCAGKPNVGETVLYKLLYFSEFNYYELYEEHMVGATFRKLPYGPVPQRVDIVLKKMEEKGELQMIKTPYYDKVQKRYIPLVKPDLSLLSATEKEVIDQVINNLADYSATAISDYSHKDMPWKATKEGDVISYNLAFYRELPYSVRTYNEDEEGEE